MISRVDHVELNARDIAKTVAFYRDVLGFEVTRWVRAERGGRVAEVACLALDDFMIEILRADEEQVNQRATGLRMLALRVDDMSSTVAALEQQGVRLAGAPNPNPLTFHGIRAEILDPDGVHVELRQWQHGDNYRGTEWRPADDVELRG